MWFFLVLAFIALIITLVAVKIFNELVVLRNSFNNAFKQIDVQLKRRYDLIPNLVEAVKGYMKFERDTLEAVIKARNTAVSVSQQAALKPGDPAKMKDLGSANSALSETLGRLMAVVEAYPELKANQNMSMLMEELNSTENRIAFARQAFNDTVMEYNITREKFPNNFVSGPFGFEAAALLDSTSSPQEREGVKISFA